jgi:hypothetical protein
MLKYKFDYLSGRPMLKREEEYYSSNCSKSFPVEQFMKKEQKRRTTKGLSGVPLEKELKEFQMLCSRYDTFDARNC